MEENSVSPDLVKNLLQQASLPDADLKIEYFQTGGNNTIYRVLAGEQEYALKKYKTSPGDNRDRLGGEWNFLSALQKSENNAPVPKTYAVDPANGLGLYSFVKGSKLQADKIGDAEMAQVLNFLRMINTPAMRQNCTELSEASEAQFSAAGHLDILKARINKIKTLPSEDMDFIAFLSDLENAAIELQEKIVSDVVLDRQQQCISPSDFGFHNALSDNGKLTFIDFEYAGWDDPAKLAADFFFQPETTVDDKYYPQFLDAALEHLQSSEREAQRKRAVVLRPIFGLRWCCIILNPFDPAWAKKHENKISGEILDKLRASRFNSARNCLAKTQKLISLS